MNMHFAVPHWVVILTLLCLSENSTALIWEWFKTTPTRATSTTTTTTEFPLPRTCENICNTIRCVDDDRTYLNQAKCVGGVCVCRYLVQKTSQPRGISSASKTTTGLCFDSCSRLIGKGLGTAFYVKLDRLPDQRICFCDIRVNERDNVFEYCSATNTVCSGFSCKMFGAHSEGNNNVYSPTSCTNETQGVCACDPTMNILNGAYDSSRAKILTEGNCYNQCQQNSSRFDKAVVTKLMARNSPRVCLCISKLYDDGDYDA